MMLDVVKVVNYNDTLLIRLLTTDATLDETYEVVLVDATSGARSITLPSVTSVTTRKVYRVKKVDGSANTVTVFGFSGQLIDGALTQLLAAQWDSISIVTNGFAWYKF